MITKLYGKTRIGLNAIETVRKRYPDLSVIVVVPTDILRNQWLKNLDQRGLGWNCKVQIINTASKIIDQCDLLILDKFLSSLNQVNCGKLLRELNTNLLR